MGFFADVGPLTVFVSHQVSTHFFVLLHLAFFVVTLMLRCSSQLIHPELKFDPNSNPPSFASEDQASPYVLS